MGNTLKLAVLISGRGSNLQALIDACANPDFPADIKLVISNVQNAPGLDKASNANIPTSVISHKDFSNKQDFERALCDALKKQDIDLICLAGFMRVLSPWFVTQWPNQIINIHPSLLPAFKGLYGVSVHQAALADGVKISGCTVHFVRAEVDDGPIIAQTAVPVLPDDTAETLGARVLAVEHKTYPLAIQLLAEGNCTIDGKRVLFKNTGNAEDLLISPRRAA